MRARPTEAFIFAGAGPAKSRVEVGSVSVPSCGVSAPPASRSQSLLPVIAACILVIAGFFAIVLSSRPYVWIQPASGEPYNLVVEGFRQGHVWMAKEAPPALAAAANPYAFSTYRPYLGAPWGLIDLSYYKGHLFAYFGVTPTVILFWPWRALTGSSMHQAQGVLLFSVIGYGVSVWLAVAAWRRYFPSVGPWTAAGAALLLGSATTLPVFLVRPGLYEVSISCAFMLTMLCLAALWESWHRDSGKAAWLAAASLAYGLAVGARPTLLFGAGILLVPVWTAYRAQSRGEPVPSWLRLLAAAVLPIAAVGAGLAAYNFLRFDDPLQFGHEYQLSGNDVFGTKSFALHFFWDNVRLYFLEPLRWHAGFPYVWRPPTPSLSEGHLPVEFFFGTLTNLPILLAAGLILLERAGVLGARGFPGGAAILALLFAATALPICFYAGATSRYLVDFIPALALLAVVGFFGVEDSPGDPSPSQPVQAAVALKPVLRVALAYSVAVGWLLAVALGMYYRGAEQATQLVAAGRIDDAIPMFEHMDRINPEARGTSDLAIGNGLMGAARFREALRFLRAAVEESPGLGAAHFSLGQALLQVGDNEGAADSFRKAVALDPLDWEAEEDLGFALYRAGHVSEAVEHEKTALRIEPHADVARSILDALQPAGSPDSPR
jgi:tetratricopeptide (TPR) repeat protein